MGCSPVNVTTPRSSVDYSDQHLRSLAQAASRLRSCYWEGSQQTMHAHKRGDYDDLERLRGRGQISSPYYECQGSIVTDVPQLIWSDEAAPLGRSDGPLLTQSGHWTLLQSVTEQNQGGGLELGQLRSS